ncbi:DNA-directed DNA polymerase [Tanacetum coccineum]
MPVKEAETKNGAKNGAGNKSIKTPENKETVETPSSQPIAYYLKHKINEKLIKGLVNNNRFNNSRSGTRVGKKKGKEYKVLPGGPVYDAILKKKITKKEDIGGNFKIPCSIGDLKHVNALVDQGSDVNVMPYSTLVLEWEEKIKLHLIREMKFNQWRSKNFKGKRPTLVATKEGIDDEGEVTGIAENVIVKFDKFIFPVDFVVLDMKEDHKIPIILGRPFLATTHAMIDVFNKKISFEVGNETITFDIEKSMKFSTPEDDECLSVDMVDKVVSDLVHEILPSILLDSFLFEPIVNYQQKSDTNLWEEEDDDSDDLDKSVPPSDHDNWEPIRPTLFATNTFETKKQPPKLKELPSHLEYAFLNNNQEFPVIISSLLNSQEKESLLKVLTQHKAALAWKVADIKGISPSFCTHKILMEDNFKPVVQPQRRLNPKVQDVVKAEIVKLLDSGLIYAISDSPWVSPIHVVPKKGG